MLKKIKLMVLFFLFLTLSPIFAYEEFDEVQDPGVRATLQGMRSFQVHWSTWMFYTINTHTPGFLEPGAYNSRIKNDDNSFRVDHVPFTRFTSGPMTETGRDLDFYVDAESKGFFLVKIPGTYAYTRDGRFMLDTQRRIVTLMGGYPLMGENGEIYLPEGDDISISKSGSIFVNGSRIDRMKIVVFANGSDMQNLETLNGSFFILTKPILTLEGPEYYRVVQGAIEESNVAKAINGDIIAAKNYYESSARISHALNKSLTTSASLMAP